ncbi:MAG: hypothetical protein Q8J84_06230 [Flavobacteriaceae bacterium]|nr:hypothetical protein [Flavobacteriaceae bacterium]
MLWFFYLSKKEPKKDTSFQALRQSAPLVKLRQKQRCCFRVPPKLLQAMLQSGVPYSKFNRPLKKVVKIGEAAQRPNDKKLFDPDAIGRVLFIGGGSFRRFSLLF